MHESSSPIENRKHDLPPTTLMFRHDEPDSTPYNKPDASSAIRASGCFPTWAAVVASLAIGASLNPPWRGVATNLSRHPFQVAVSNWTDLKSVVSGGATSIELLPAFISNYDSEISISGNDITINGNGVVLDAGQNGRFFSLLSSWCSIDS